MKKLKIGDLCEILNGYAFKSDKYVKDGIRVIRITNVQKGFVEDEKPQFYPIAEINNVKDYMLEEDDLLVSLTGNVGRVAMLDRRYLPAALNQRVACLRVKNIAVLKKYLYYSLLTKKFEDDCIVAAKGIAQKNMSTEWLKKYEINIPLLTEQEDIIKVMDRLSAIICDRNKEIEALDKLIKSQFIEMFGDPVINPKKWKVKPLVEMGKCKNGMNFHYDDTGVEINCLGVGDFKDLSIINETKCLPKVTLNEMPSEEYLLKDDDIVFVRSNGNKSLVGRSVAVYPHEVPTTFSGFCIRFRNEDNGIIVPYLLRVLKAESMRVKMAGRGANIQNLNQQILSTLLIPIPPLELQNEFAQFVKQVDKLKFEVQKALDDTQMMFDSLMNEYFG